MSVFVSLSPSGGTLLVGDSALVQATTNVPGTTGFSWSLSDPTKGQLTAANWLKGLKAGPLAVTACVTPPQGVCGLTTINVQ